MLLLTKPTVWPRFTDYHAGRAYLFLLTKSRILLKLHVRCRFTNTAEEFKPQMEQGKRGGGRDSTHLKLSLQENYCGTTESDSPWISLPPPREVIYASD